MSESSTQTESFELKRVSFRKSGNSTLRRTLVPVVLVLLWVLISETRIVDPLFLPPPQALWSSLVNLIPVLPAALLSSVSMTLLGFIIGTTFGIASGLMMAYSKVVRELFSNLFDMLRPVPIFALIPLFLIWFGIGKAPQITLIALGTSVTLGVITIDAIRNVSPVHIQAALTLGASRGSVYRTVIVPSIFPHLLGGIRVAALASWGLDVAAEFLGAQEGLGHTMIVQQQYLDTAGIMLICIIYSILAILLDTGLMRMEARLTRWTNRSTRGGPVASLLGRG